MPRNRKPLRRKPASAAPARAADARTPLHADVVSLRRRLVRWYRASRRSLPWRGTRDPYRIWVSEIMLQQTRVDVVVPYYERFVGRFPDVTSLARARLDDVLHAWSGLGYYTRARHLHRAAQQIVEQHGGQLPDSVAVLESLPGVGRYTAGAIASIAFGRPAPILDGNVVRVFARLFALDGDVDSAPQKRRMWEIAAEWAATPSPGDANQALMELGAIRCTKPLPLCGECPLERDCGARRSGREQLLPRPRRRKASDVVQLSAALLQRGERLLLIRRRTGRLLQDWWELPTRRRGDVAAARGPAHSPTNRRAAHALRSALRSRLDLLPPPLERIAAVRHGILNHRIEVEILASRLPTDTRAAGDSARKRRARRPRQAERSDASRPGATPLDNLELDDLEVRWLDAAQCRRLPLSTLARKALRAAAAVNSRWSRYLQQEVREQRADDRRRHPAE
ncbi:MAG: A/G-specific adenine glycosylase [Candidatus Latescibacterota bacterium]|nr:MAG: A/G-specific adenine glycosylase [Candidatus Latescibacterota bacterium]